MGVKEKHPVAVGRGWWLETRLEDRQPEEWGREVCYVTAG